MVGKMKKVNTVTPAVWWSSTVNGLLTQHFSPRPCLPEGRPHELVFLPTKEKLILVTGWHTHTHTQIPGLSTCSQALDKLWEELQWLMWASGKIAAKITPSNSRAPPAVGVAPLIALCLLCTGKDSEYSEVQKGRRERQCCKWKKNVKQKQKIKEGKKNKEKWGRSGKKKRTESRERWEERRCRKKVRKKF